MDLASGHCWLEDIGRVDGTFSTARTDEGVEFIDEEDDIACSADFIHDRFDAFFELAAVLGAGDHHREVEYDDAFFVEDIGDLVRDDPLGEPFDDRGLADACFAQEHRVVFGASAQDLGESFDLVGSTDDRIEVPVNGELGEVAPEGIECGCF